MTTSRNVLKNLTAEKITPRVALLAVGIGFVGAIFLLYYFNDKKKKPSNTPIMPSKTLEADSDKLKDETDNSHEQKEEGLITPSTLIARLTEPENTSQIPGFLQESVKFVGLVKTKNHSGVGCLLADGNFITCLHVIYDFSTKKYEPIDSITVLFISNQNLYEYTVSGIIHDGSKIFIQDQRMQATNFDFALLRLHGNPSEELGGKGVELDKKNYFSDLLADKPNKTTTLSCPLVFLNEEDGSYHSTRHSSSSGAVISTHFTYPQLGQHFSEPGLSGMPIFYFENNRVFLYALHSSRDKIGFIQTGVAISGYLENLRIYSDCTPSLIPSYCQTKLNVFGWFSNKTQEELQGSLLTYEVLKKGEIDSIRIFFQSLIKFLNKEIKEEDTLIKNAPVFTKNKQVLDTHQDQHLGGRSKKSSFNFKNSSIVNVLAQCINKIISDHYRRNKKKNKIDKYLKDPFENYRKSTTFCIDMGFVICDQDVDTRKPATGIILTPFGDRCYHIYPVDLDNPKYKDPKKYVLIDANEILSHLPTRSSQNVSSNKKK